MGSSWEEKHKLFDNGNDFYNVNISNISFNFKKSK